MHTLVITKSDLRQILERVGLDTLMDEMIRRLTHALKGFDERHSTIKPRDGFQYTYPHPGVIEWMPSMRNQETITVKMVAYNPKNPERENLPTILSSASLYDAQTGSLRCLCDATFLTALRTGAASAIASQHLAREDAHILGMIGCGAQAVSQIHALSRCFPLREILVFDVAAAQCHSLPQRLAPLGLAVRVADVETVVQHADILCTATSVAIGEGPVFPPTEVKPWLHINAIGSDLPGKTELPLALLQKAFVCPDFPAQAKVEGECQQLADAAVGASLVDVVKQPEEFASLRTSLSIFDSTGYALEDQIALEMLHHYAQADQLGTPMHIEALTEDVYNPYSLLASPAPLQAKALTVK